MQSVFSLSDNPIKSRLPRKQRPAAQPDRSPDHQQQQKASDRPSSHFYAPIPVLEFVPQTETVQEPKEVSFEEAWAALGQLEAALAASTFVFSSTVNNADICTHLIQCLSIEQQSLWFEEEEFFPQMCLAF